MPVRGLTERNISCVNDRDMLDRICGGRWGDVKQCCFPRSALRTRCAVCRLSLSLSPPNSTCITFVDSQDMLDMVDRWPLGMLDILLEQRRFLRGLRSVVCATQAEYEREAIDWSYITFVDNQDVLDLIERRPLGILDILDEQCRFPRVRACLREISVAGSRAFWWLVCCGLL